MRRRFGTLRRRGMAMACALLLAVSTALLVVGLAADLARAEGTATSLGADLARAGSLRKVPGPSPALTLERFLALTAEADTLIREAVRQGQAEPGWLFTRAVNHKGDHAVALFQQATQALDLSKVPEALRPMTGVGTLLMLRSLVLFDLSQNPGLAIPNTAQAQREQLSLWTIPETSITLTALTPSKVSTGLACSQCTVGDFLFSAETLARVPADFAQVFSGDDALQRRYGADLFTYWALVPGMALPPKPFLRLPLAVRHFLLTPLAGQSLLQWLLLLPVTLLGLLLMGWWIHTLHRWRARRGDLAGVVPHLLGLLAILPLLALVWAWRWYAISWINLIGPREAAVLVIVRVAQGLLQVVLVYLLAETLGQIITLRRRSDGFGAVVLERRKGSGQILTIARLVGVIAALAVAIKTGQDLGLTSLTLLGLASVPALAISLGTQQLIRDIADGFSLLFDGQLLPGDRCTVGTAKSGLINGEITSLGMRSLRILQDDGSILSMPNSQVASSVVTNHRFRTTVPLHVSLPIAEEALPRVNGLLEQARQLLGDGELLSDATAELEATESGWALKLKGHWRSELAQPALEEARERLYLRLIDLTHPGGEGSIA